MNLLTFGSVTSTKNQDLSKDLKRAPHIRKTKGLFGQVKGSFFNSMALDSPDTCKTTLIDCSQVVGQAQWSARCYCH